MLIAPASANVIGKLANGIADDMLTTTAMACRAPIYVSPTMNVAMYKNAIVQDNLEKLRRFNFNIIEPASGFLACRDTGKGKMPEPEVLLEYILKEIAYEKDMEGKRVLITAGPTREAIDPVRYITNHSTGKMGYALAKAAMQRGAKVTLVSGPVNIKEPSFVEVVPVVSADEMAEAVLERCDNMDYLFFAAAVADYTPKDIFEQKVKKSGEEMTLTLKNTVDILKTVGERKKNGQVLCGFCMETEDLINRAKDKRIRKNADMIVANSLREEGAGFGTDTNVVTLISENESKELPLMSKNEVAHEILNEVLKIK